MSRPLTPQFLFVSLVVGVISQVASACPFCAAVSQTFSEEIKTMDAVVIAKLVALPKVSDSADPNAEVAKAKFEVSQVIKGESLVKSAKYIETIYFGEAKQGQKFLVMGVDPPKLMWSTPLQLSAHGEKYISKLLTLPDKGADRLYFFQEYLEHKDEMLARDAYDEFAKAPYEEVKALKSRMNHMQLVAWIMDTDVPASRRRLYLTMLGVCGTEKDLPMLEKFLKSKDRKQKAGLDAMIACYLTLRGEDGMPLIEDLFLKNKKAEYADTYAAIMAVRFHGTQAGDIIPRERLLAGLRHMLERPQLADLVIPDLARWKDWSVMEKLVKLFKDADEKSSWVRVPVVNYLRACPLPESKKYIKELEKVDPQAVKRAHTFFPVTPSSDDEEKSNAQRPKDQGDQKDSDKQKEAAADAVSLVPPPGKAVAEAGNPIVRGGNAPAAGSAVIAEQSLNPFLTLGVTFVSAIALMVLLWSILRGTGSRAMA